MIFSELMDSRSLFLTANADTVYYLGIIDLTSGPMVVETPPNALGIFDDMWFHWIIDFGLPGPDRGQGGKFLLLPPGYDGPLPDSGFHVGHSNTNQVLFIGRSFLQDNDPKPTVEVIKRTLRVYPYTPGGYGSSVATLLEGKVPAGTAVEPPETQFLEASGKAFNTIPPSDFGFYELLNAMIQEQPATATDAETTGVLAAIGIVKGQPFAPDERMRKILDEAAAVGHATARALLFDARESEGVRFYPNSAWTNMLFPGGYTFETPPPLVTEEGIKPFPSGGAKKLNVRTLFFYSTTPRPSATPRPGRSGWARPRPRASATTTVTPPGGTCCSSAGSSSPTHRPTSLRKASCPTRTRAPADCTPAPRCSTPPPPSPLPCACG
ncbi:DUF1254 domain-containing protein [Nocardia abscessus]|uniref:DUF1254 domain-containing protein n=1 Tax=Nocardia abscessus TaxID=120957 RepID=UPI002B4B56C0|nr:DUF1254 domain-containing protein [Nocardia abscessus]